MESYKKILFGYYVAENEEREPGNYDINGDEITDSSQIAMPMHDISFKSITTPKEVGKRQRELLGQTMNERFKNSIEFYKCNGYKISGIILKGVNHSGIFNINSNPNLSYFAKQISEFYYDGKLLTESKEACVPSINESFQISRNNQEIRIK